MSESVDVWRLAVFSEARSGGNPAGVVLAAGGLTDAAMQAIAARVGDSETAFVVGGDGAGRVDVRFFTPACEVPVCGHATLATHAVLALRVSRRSGSVVQRSPGAEWQVSWRAEPGRAPHVTMVQAPVTWGRVVDGHSVATLYGALGGGRPAVAPPPRIVSTGHAKIVVPVASVSALRRLRPDMDALRGLTEQLGVPGVFAFALAEPGDDVRTECRMFAPGIGVPEDPVNGSGHGPLAAYLAAYGLLEGAAFVSRMGVSSGREGRVHVAVEREAGAVTRVHVGGHVAVIERLTMDAAAFSPAGCAG